MRYQKIGIAKRIKNDVLPKAWSTNHVFRVGETYDLYRDGECGQKVISGNDGIMYKLVPACWTMINNNQEN